MFAKILMAAMIASLALLAGACQTSMTRAGQQLTDDEVAQIEAADDTEEMDFTAERIKSVIETLNYRNGSPLLRNLQYLIVQGPNAVDPIVESIDEVPPRTQANLLYVLGFTNSDSARTTLRRFLAHDDEIVRFEAAAGLLNQGDYGAAPRVIAFLSSGEQKLRYKAIQILRLVTGEDFGYRFGASSELRNAATGRWKSWWQREQERLMLRPASISE